jgi:transposase
VFVREIKNKNGKVYIQVIEKLKGKYVVRKSFGSGTTPQEIQDVKRRAELWIKDQSGVLELDFTNERELLERAISSITSHKLVGIDLTIGKIFDQIGFNQIKDKLFRHLVLYRLVYPKSKLKTTEYLYRFEGTEYSEDEIYRYMDKLYNTHKQEIQRISYEHTLGLFPEGIQVVFYDVTTVYFEIDLEDDLRKTGFSKEGRHQNPQIVLGLLVSRDGYPLAYDIFEGNKFEGHTMMPIIDSFKQKYELENLVIVADSGLMSRSNIQQLTEQDYEFILGARIKNESTDIQNKILSLDLKNAESKVINKGDLRLIITYSDQRAAKDRYNREKGIRRLKKQIQRGRLTKDNLNKRGYNKFLQMDGQVNVRLNQQKIVEDKKWDGLKGYITNSKLNKDELIANYQQLWQIEKAFRIAKSELKLRPIYHRKQKRIEAHICLNFAAYKVYKELERFLKQQHSDLSPQKVIEIAQSIYQIQMTTPTNKETISRTLVLTQEHQVLNTLFQFGC